MPSGWAARHNNQAFNWPNPYSRSSRRTQREIHPHPVIGKHHNFGDHNFGDIA
jgi:hypothetical protein